MRSFGKNYSGHETEWWASDKWSELDLDFTRTGFLKAFLELLRKKLRFSIQPRKKAVSVET
jgi:hypothetical protein